MERRVLFPDKKLFTKQIYVLLTITAFFGIIALFIQILLPIGRPTAGEVALVLWPVFLFINLVIYSIVLTLVKLWIKNLKYTIEEERIRLNKGIITKIEQTIPFKAVTDFQLHRSLYDRVLGIASIKIQTAGQTQNPSGYEAVFSGLTNWESLIEELREQIMHVQRGGFAARGVVDTNETPDISDLITEVKKIREILEKRKE